MKRNHFYFFILAAILGTVYYAYNPMDSGFFPKCPFYVLTGWKCPGCGSQRAIHALLHGDVAGAFVQNSFMMLCIPYLAMLGYAEWRRKDKPELYRKLHRTCIIRMVFVLVVGWWVGRNLAGI